MTHTIATILLLAVFVFFAWFLTTKYPCRDHDSIGGVLIIRDCRGN